MHSVYRLRAGRPGKAGLFFGQGLITHGCVYENPAHRTTGGGNLGKLEIRRKKHGSKEMIRIGLKAYDHQLIDKAAETSSRDRQAHRRKVSVPSPCRRRKGRHHSRAVHKYKDSREQFERRTQRAYRHRSPPEDRRAS